MLKARAASDDETRAAVAAELRSVREAAQEAAGTRAAVLPPPRPAAEAPGVPAVGEIGPPAVLAKPDNAQVNALWALPSIAPGHGIRGFLRRLVRRAIGPFVDAQVSFNSQQVQLDNQ